MNQERSRHNVRHDYHDHLNESTSGKDFCINGFITEPFRESSKYDLPNEINEKAPSRNEKFPLKLLALLDNAERKDIPHIISWQTHGRAFKMHNSKEFCTTVMPIHFNQSKISSFFRQLYLYGFRRITQGRDKGAYYHERFLRGMAPLAQQMVRQRIKGTKAKSLVNPENEPDFYAMPYVPEVSRSTPVLSVSRLTRDSPTLLSNSDDLSLSPDLKNKKNINFFVNKAISEQKLAQIQNSVDQDLTLCSWENDLYDVSVLNAVFGGKVESKMSIKNHSPYEFSLPSDYSGFLHVENEFQNNEIQNFSFEECQVLLAVINDATL